MSNDLTNQELQAENKRLREAATVVLFGVKPIPRISTNTDPDMSSLETWRIRNLANAMKRSEYSVKEGK